MHRLQLRVFTDAGCQPAAQPVTAPVFINHYVTQPAKPGVVGDEAGKTNLSLLVIEAKRQRTGNRPHGFGQRLAFGPVGLLRQLDVDPRQVELLAAGGDSERLALPLLVSNL